MNNPKYLPFLLSFSHTTKMNDIYKKKSQLYHRTNCQHHIFMLHLRHQCIKPFHVFHTPNPFPLLTKKKILYSEKGRLPDGDPFSFLYKDLPQHLICSVIHKLFVAWPWKHFGEQNRHNPHYYTLCLRKWKLIEWRINLHF